MIVSNTSAFQSPWCFVDGDPRYLALHIQVVNGCDFLDKRFPGALNRAGATLVTVQSVTVMSILMLLVLQIRFLIMEKRKGKNANKATNISKRKCESGKNAYSTEVAANNKVAGSEGANETVIMCWSFMIFISSCLLVFCIDPTIWGILPTLMTFSANVAACLGMCVFMFFVQYLIPKVRKQHSAGRLKMLLVLQSIVIPPSLTSIFAAASADLKDLNSLQSNREIFELFQVVVALVMICNSISLMNLGCQYQNGKCSAFELCGTTRKLQTKQSDKNVSGSIYIQTSKLDRKSYLAKMSEDPGVSLCLRKLLQCCVHQIAPYRLGLLGILHLFGVLSASIRFLRFGEKNHVTIFIVRYFGLYTISMVGVLALGTWLLHSIFTKRNHHDVGSVLMSAHSVRSRKSPYSSKSDNTPSLWDDSDSDSNNSEVRTVSGSAEVELKSLHTKENLMIREQDVRMQNENEKSKEESAPSLQPRLSENVNRSKLKHSRARALSSRHSILMSEVALGMRNTHVHHHLQSGASAPQMKIAKILENEEPHIHVNLSNASRVKSWHPQATTKTIQGSHLDDSIIGSQNKESNTNNMKRHVRTRQKFKRKFKLKTSSNGSATAQQSSEIDEFRSDMSDPVASSNDIDSHICSSNVNDTGKYIDNPMGKESTRHENTESKGSENSYNNPDQAEESDVSAMETWADRMDGVSWSWRFVLMTYRAWIAIVIVLFAMPTLRYAFDSRWDGICSKARIMNASASALNKCKDHGYEVLWSEHLNKTINTSLPQNATTHNVTTANVKSNPEKPHLVTGFYITVMQFTMSIAGVYVCTDILPMSSDRGGQLSISSWCHIAVPTICLICQVSMSLFVYTQSQPLTASLSMNNTPILLTIFDILIWLIRILLPWLYCLLWWRPLKQLLKKFQAESTELALNAVLVLSHVLSEKALKMYALPFSMSILGIVIAQKSKDTFITHLTGGFLIVCFFLPGLAFFWKIQKKGIFGIGPGIPYIIILTILMFVFPSGVQGITKILLTRSTLWDTTIKNSKNHSCFSIGATNPNTQNHSAAVTEDLETAAPNLSVISCYVFDGKVQFLLPVYLLVRCELFATFFWLKQLVRIAHGDEKFGYQLSSRLIWPFMLCTDIFLMVLFLEFDPLNIEFCMLNLVFGFLQMLKDGGFLTMFFWRAYKKGFNQCRKIKKSFFRKHQTNSRKEKSGRTSIGVERTSTAELDKKYCSEWTKLQRAWCTEVLTSEAELLAPLVVLTMICVDLMIAGVWPNRLPNNHTTTMNNLDISDESTWYGWKMPLSILCVLTTRILISQMSTIAWHWRLNEFAIRYNHHVLSGELEELEELSVAHFGLTTTQSRYRATLWHKHAKFFSMTTVAITLYIVYLHIQQKQADVETEFGLEW